MTRSHRVFAGALSASLAAATAVAGADEQLSATDLQAQSVVSLRDLFATDPSLTATPLLSSGNTLSVFMRGEGLDNPVQITRDGAVGIYQDGFPILRSQALTFDLGEINGIQVLQGPQGTLYGRNTTGGVINITTRAPSGELGFRQTVDFGNRNSFRVLSALDSPRWHGLAARLEVLASSTDGYVKNLSKTSHNYGEEKQRGGRLRLQWDAFSELRADYFIEKNNLDSTPAYDTNPSLNGQPGYFVFTYFANPNGPMSQTYRRINLPLSTSDHLAQGLTLTWQPLAALTVKSLTGYRRLNADAKQDYADFAGFAETTDDLYHGHQLSQELQLSANLFHEQLTGLAGLSYVKEHGSHLDVIDAYGVGFAFATDVTADTLARAAYLQLNWLPDFLARRIELSAGARYTRESKQAVRLASNTGGVLENGAASGAVNHLDYHRVTPAATLSYSWTDRITSYVRGSTSYRAGGALESAPIGEFATSTFRPETLLTYEVGTRATFLRDRLHVDLVAFQSRERDAQYALPGIIGTDSVYTLQKATLRGVELGISAKPLASLAITTTAEYLNTTIDRVDVLPGSVFDPAVTLNSPYKVGADISDLFTLPFAPKYSFNTGTDYTLFHTDQRDIRVHLDYTYRARFATDAGAGRAVPGAGFAAVPAAGLLNARMSWSEETDWSHRITVSLWGKNVLNRRYYAYATGVGAGIGSFADGASAPEGYSARAGAWAAPVSYGIDVNYRY